MHNSGEVRTWAITSIATTKLLLGAFELTPT